MERKYKLVLLFASTYIGVIIYPFSYLLSPLLTVTQHQLFLGGIIMLLLPAYLVGFKHFRLGLFTKTVKYSVLYGSAVQRLFAGMIIFLLIGIGNGILISVTTDLNVLIFSYWNPYIETIVLASCLFAILIQVALVQYFKELLPSQSEIESAIEAATSVMEQ